LIPGAGIDTLVNRNVPLLCQKMNPGCQPHSPIAIMT